MAKDKTLFAGVKFVIIFILSRHTVNDSQALNAFAKSVETEMHHFLSLKIKCPLSVIDHR